MPATQILIHERTGNIAAAVMPHLRGMPVLVRQTRSLDTFNEALRNNPFTIILLESEEQDRDISILLREAALWHALTVVVSPLISWETTWEMRELGVVAILAPGMPAATWGPFLVRLLERSQQSFDSST